MHMYNVLGVLCCFALFVCLTLLASFFLPSHLSFKNMYKVPPGTKFMMYTGIHIYNMCCLKLAFP